MLGIALTLVPLPLAAADRAAAPPAQPLKASIAKHATQDALVVAPKGAMRSAAQTSRTPSADPRTGGFFHSPAGIACIAVVAAGTGYAVYSASHDRIHSVARK